MFYYFFYTYIEGVDMSHLNLTVPETIEKLFFSLALRLSDPAFNVRDYLLFWWILVKFGTKLTVSLQYQYQKIQWLEQPCSHLGEVVAKYLFPLSVFALICPIKCFPPKKMRQKEHRPWRLWRTSLWCSPCRENSPVRGRTIL